MILHFHYGIIQEKAESRIACGNDIIVKQYYSISVELGTNEQIHVYELTLSDIPDMYIMSI